MKIKEDELAVFAQDFLKNLKSGDDATVVGLSGDLGSGKTTFVQAVGKILGVKEPIQSPTFVLVKNYKLLTTNYKLLIHIDAYRLETGSDIEKLGFNELLNDSANLIFIEWPERIASAMPPNVQKIYFTFVDQTTREIEIQG